MGEVREEWRRGCKIELGRRRRRHKAHGCRLIGAWKKKKKRESWSR